MIARHGLPGERRFEWKRFMGRGAKKAALDWLQKRWEEWQGVSGQNPPAQEVLSEREASKVRWRDGRRVFERIEE